MEQMVVGQYINVALEYEMKAKNTQTRVTSMNLTVHLKLWLPLDEDMMTRFSIGYDKFIYLETPCSQSRL